MSMDLLGETGGGATGGEFTWNKSKCMMVIGEEMAVVERKQFVTNIFKMKLCEAPGIRSGAA